jgi:HPt (histidine-containing phosphotransfer) domain-containing protein
MTSESRIDPSVINELIDLGPETGLQLVKDLLELFSAETPLRIAAMRDGIRRGDFNEVAQAAHAMRGGAGNLGAVSVGALCTRIEQEAKGENGGGLSTLVDHLEAELDFMQAHLTERLAGME